VPHFPTLRQLCSKFRPFCRMSSVADQSPARWLHRLAVALCVLLAGCAEQTDPFPTLYPVDSRQQLEVLGEVELRPRDAADERTDQEYSAISRKSLGKDWLYRSGPWERMPAEMYRVLGRVSVEQARQGVSIVVDVAGTPSADKRKSHLFAAAPLRIDIICQPGAAACAALDRQRYSHALPGAERGARLHDAKVEITNEHELMLDGQRKKLSIGQTVYDKLITPAFPAEVRVAFWANQDLQPEYLRIRLVQQPHRFMPPHPHLAKGARIALLLALLALAFASWLRSRRSEPFDNPESPRRLGLLLAVWGLLMLGAGWHIDSLYYALTGLLILLTGRCLYFGQVLALPLAGLMLLIVWSWSIPELGMGRELAARVLLPTLLVGYLALSGISQGLGRIERDFID